MAGHATRRLVTRPIRDRDRFRVEEDGPATGLTVPFHPTNRRFGRFDELVEGSRAGGRRPGRAGGRRGVRIFEPGGPVSRRVVGASGSWLRSPATTRARAWSATSVLDNALTIDDERAKARLRGEVARSFGAGRGRRPLRARARHPVQWRYRPVSEPEGRERPRTGGPPSIPICWVGSLGRKAGRRSRRLQVDDWAGECAGYASY